MEHALWPLFDAIADEIGDRDAIVWRDRRLSYAALRDRSRRFAAVLHQHGLGRHRPRAELQPWQSGQDFVATYLLNGPEYLEVTLGAYAAATAPFNVNYRYVADELAYLLDDADTSAIVFHGRFAPVLEEVLPRLRRQPELLLQVDDGSEHKIAEDYETALAHATPWAATDADPDDLYVLYTGGTTGMPKGTLWRQADIYAAALSEDPDADRNALVDAAVANTRGRVLPNAPFMHGAAQWVALRALLAGGTVIVNDTVDHLDTDEAWRIVERERVDTMLMVGEAMARPLVQSLESTPCDPSSLFVILVGGAVTSPETKERIIARIPGAMIADTAGASETGGALLAVTAKGRPAPAGIFQPAPTVAVLDPALERMLAPGDEQVGWFAKRGRIPLGYLNDETKTAATFPIVEGQRWSVPGDRARWLADGTIELLGRDSVTINTGGEKVFAEEVEAALLTHPAVADVIVVGRPSERWGQEVVAVVALQAPAADDDLLAAAGRRIARYKLPRAIIRVPTVVRSPAGKADYRWAQAKAREP